MDWQILLLIVSFILFGLLLIGEWIVFALGIAGTIFLYIVGGLPALRPIGGIVWENASNVTLSAIPLFILMGQLILQSKCGERFYHGMSMIFGRVPGGLLHTNIISCGIFAALSGVSVATAATIGTIAIPELTKRGYDRKMNFGSLVAGGTLGVLIPPAVPLILYGVLTQQSVTKLFAAGILPGIMMMLLFTAYICVRVFFNPKLAGVPLATDLARFSLSAFFVSVFPVVGLILVCMGGIYLGFMTPTEAGAVGAVLAMGIFLWFKGFDTQALKTVFRQTIRSSVMILFIAVGAQIFSFSMAYGDLNQMMAGWVVSKATSPAIIYNSRLLSRSDCY
jgi:tripartite ATP-independent transporter DctM subunit